MAKYGADTIPTCHTCDSRNETKSCKKCAVVFCKHFASVTDYKYCGNCLGDFTIKETIMEKIVEREQADGTITFSRKSQARHLTLQGTDWLFAAHLIEEMDDADIEATIEYHRANVSLMLQERESRKLERYKKLANIKIVHKKNETQEEREKREAKEASKAGRKTKVKEKELTADSIVQMLGALAKAGLTQEQLISLMGGKK